MQFVEAFVSHGSHPGKTGGGGIATAGLGVYPRAEMRIGTGTEVHTPSEWSIDVEQSMGTLREVSPEPVQKGAVVKARAKWSAGSLNSGQQLFE